MFVIFFNAIITVIIIIIIRTIFFFVDLIEVCGALRYIGMQARIASVTFAADTLSALAVAGRLISRFISVWLQLSTLNLRRSS
jgi:hypothetical protein